MSDRIDELVDTTSVAVLNISSREEKDAGYAAIRELATIARKAEAERDALLVTVTAAYFLLNSDQCTHGGDDWNDPECRVCNLRRAFDALPHDVRDRLASMTYAERVIRGE